MISELDAYRFFIHDCANFGLYISEVIRKLLFRL